MNPVWSITLAEKHPLPRITLHYAAPDEESARTGIQKWYPGREIVSVLLNEEHSNKNPNSNCLEGFECPACGSYGPFYIRATVTGETLVCDDGTEGVMGDVEWDDNSACRCADCGHPGTVREFMGKPAPEFDAFQQIVANTYDNGEHECHTPDDIDTCGDSLLMFLMRELSLSEDCDSIEEAISRVDVAIRQLEAVRDGLEVASLDRAHTRNLVTEIKTDAERELQSLREQGWTQADFSRALREHLE